MRQFIQEYKVLENVNQALFGEEGASGQFAVRLDDIEGNGSVSHQGRVKILALTAL